MNDKADLVRAKDPKLPTPEELRKLTHDYLFNKIIAKIVDAAKDGHKHVYVPIHCDESSDFHNRIIKELSIYKARRLEHMPIYYFEWNE